MSIHRVVAASAAALALVTIGCGAELKRFAYEGFGRDDWQKPDEVVSALELSPGDSVADLGAGGGYFTFRLAHAVGDSGRVYAVDVDPDMIGLLDEKIAGEGASQVRTVLADPSDPKLPRAGIDLVFTSNTYHHIGDRTNYFERLREALAPGGRVAVVEYAESSWWQFGAEHYTGPDVIRSEMLDAGYELEREHEFLPRQSFQVFRPRNRR